MRLHDSFESSAPDRALRTAIVMGTRRVSYGELLRRIDILASGLVRQGVGPGDRVVVLLGDAAQYAVAVHAVLRLGAVFVPTSRLTRPARLDFVLHDTAARALITDQTLRPVWQGVEAERTVVLDEPSHAPAMPTEHRLVVVVRPQAEPAEHVPSSQLAAILYTSGTTGVPKGVMLTHDNMCNAWAMVQAYLSLRADDVVALPLAPTFSYGLYNLLISLGLGATVVAEGSFAFPRTLLGRLVDERVTVLPGVPMLFDGLLNVNDLDRFDFSALRLMTNAADALPIAHIERLRDRLPQAQLYSMYGMTECKRISYLPPTDLELRPNSVGRGILGQQHWLVDERGSVLSNGATGELVVRGPHVMQGYWARPAETAHRLKSDASGTVALHTGDIFRTDDEGFLYFVARKDDIIKTRGEKVSPREIEVAICALQGVAQAVVVGVDDAALGQAIKAYVKRVPGSMVSARDVLRQCMKTLEPYMMPKEVEFVESFVMTDSGKVQRAGLAPTYTNG